MRPTAVVMNMFYTGLGVARSLGEQGVRVIGLTSVRGVYGNFTRYARTIHCPDSRSAPEELLAFLLKMAKEMDAPCVIFPTRDHDVLFLDRYRDELSPYFIPVLADKPALEASLNKWETFQRASQANVPSPKSWMIESEEDLSRIIGEVAYPCVLKPVVASDWRTAGNWNIVGARKAIVISTREELFAEYRTVATATPVALLQEMIAGGDESLVTVACYLNRKHEVVASFGTQKLLQSPQGMGTGCIVRTASHPELVTRTTRLLQEIAFSGIAEVEYKWDAGTQDYQLIEINPRAWDQHRLGNACGVDLAYIAYCDLAGLPKPHFIENGTEYKWIAEDAFWMDVLRLLWRRDPRLRSVWKIARGRKIYGIWSARDPLPFAAFLVTYALPQMARNLWAVFRCTRGGSTKGDLIYDRHLEKGKGQI